MIKNVSLSLDFFSTAFFAMLLFLLIPYLDERGFTLHALALVAVFLIPLAVMPVIYATVHRFSPLLFGKYHLLMPVGGFLSALFLAMSFSFDGVGSGASFALILLSLALFMPCYFTYRYCAFSVSARLSGGKADGKSAFGLLFSVISVAAAVVCAVMFYRYDATTFYANSGFVLCGLVVLTSFLQYLATSKEIPSLGGKRMLSVKDSFKMFFTELDRRTYLSAVFITAGYVTAAALLVPLGLATGASFYTCMTAVGCACFAYFAGSVACYKRLRRRYRGLSAITGGIAVVASALLCICGFFPRAAAYLLISGGVLIGVGGAISFRQTEMRFLSVRTRATSGSVFVLIRLCICVAATFAAVAAGISAAGYLYGLIVGAAYAAAGFFIAIKKPRTAAVPELDVEPSENTETAEKPDQQS